MFDAVDDFSVTFCARFEKGSLKLLAMEREQKDKPLFSFRQIFDGGDFALGRPSFFKVLWVHLYFLLVSSRKILPFLFN